MATLTPADIIFSEQANHNFSRILGELKRHTLTIHNRLTSIVTDATFVRSIAVQYDKPLVANERCGSWYIDPQEKVGSAYFKSTDGHAGIWNFSTRRLNLHLLPIIEQHNGCIIVDSTRRGKSMPDALSKTVPIWCCVVNRALFPGESSCHNLHTPPQVVSASEHAQIEARMEHLLESFLALELNISALRQQITKPLQPSWITPDSGPCENEMNLGDRHVIVCCTASHRVHGGEISGGGYIQGSGDDTENWANGLTAPLFWEHRKLLMDTPEAEIVDVVKGLVENARSSSHGSIVPIQPTTSLSVVALPGEHCPQGIRINLHPHTQKPMQWQIRGTLMDIDLGQHSIGSRNLRIALPHIIQFVSMSLRAGSSTDQAIIVACETGKNHSIGVALALLCLFYDEQGRQKDSMNDIRIDKAFIKKRLGWIMITQPDANPSSATLQSVNSVLIQKPV